MNEIEGIVTKPSPDACQICEAPVNDDFVDGKTTLGPWADMCLTCYSHYGAGLGLGKGQRYQRQAGTTNFIKVEG